MRSKLLFVAIGNIDEKFIDEDAEEINLKAHSSMRVFYRFAGLAACAAVLLLCVLTIPGLFSTPVPNIPKDPGVISSGNQQGGEPAVSVTTPPDDADTITPRLRDEVWPLTLNEVSSQMAAEIYIEGHFWDKLTDRQLEAVFPNTPLALTATANYRGDGSLYNVMAFEVLTNGERAFYNEIYTATMIEVIGAGGGSMEDCFYEYEPETSSVMGVPVVAGVFDFKKNDGVALYIASFKVDGVAYNIKLFDNDNGITGLNRLTEIVNDIIYYGAADLSVLENPIIPELRDERLTLHEARNDPDFGAYLPENVPSRFSFESAQRVINQDTNNLFVYWNVGSEYIDWRVSKLTDYYYEHIVSVSEREKYDMALYSIPLADSVPRELWEYVDNPVFIAEELTFGIIQARAYWVGSDRGDTSGWRMRFSVLYGDDVIELDIKGVSPEQVWEVFAELKNS